jgi:hypothetical protein
MIVPQINADDDQIFAICVNLRLRFRMLAEDVEEGVACG